MNANGGNKARLAYTNLLIYRQALQPNGLYCVLSAAFYQSNFKLLNIKK